MTNSGCSLNDADSFGFRGHFIDFVRLRWKIRNQREECSKYYWNVVLLQGINLLSGKTSYCQVSLNLVTARFSCSVCSIVLKSNRRLGSSTAEAPVKFQNDTIISTSNLVALILCDIFVTTSYQLVNRSLGHKTYNKAWRVCIIPGPPCISLGRTWGDGRVPRM